MLKNTIVFIYVDFVVAVDMDVSVAAPSPCAAIADRYLTVPCRRARFALGTNAKPSEGAAMPGIDAEWDGA